MKVYPAYGLTIARLLMRGLKPVAIGVLLSARWNYFQDAPRVCLRPDEFAVGRFEFGFLRNQHVVAILGEEATIEQFGWLLIELMHAGPRLLWITNHFGEWIYKGDEATIVHEYATLTLREHLRDPVTFRYAPWSGPDPADRSPIAAYRAGIARQARAEYAEFQRAERAGPDALLKLHNEQQAQLRAVERAFSDPFAVPEDAATA